MDFGKSEPRKAWHILQRPIGIESGIRQAVSHPITTVTDVAIKRSDLLLHANTGSEGSRCLKTETGAEVRNLGTREWFHGQVTRLTMKLNFDT